MEVPYDAIQPETLRAMLEEYVTRDGTDYGVVELSMAEKVESLMNQLRRGELIIAYDEKLEMLDLVKKSA